MGSNVCRKASLDWDFKKECLDVPSHSFLVKIFRKQGETCDSISHRLSHLQFNLGIF